MLPPREEEDHLLEESGVLGVTEPSTPQTTATLRHLLDETADLIDSPTFTRVVLLLNNECFETLIQQCAAEAFKASHTPAPQSFTSVATVVPGAVSSEPKTKLANVLAVLARQAHVIGNGTAPPNLYLNAMEQGVRELEAFAAVVYSSNFDAELLESDAKTQSMRLPAEASSDTPSSPGPVMVDTEDIEDQALQSMSSLTVADDSTFETAWGKAVEDQPSTGLTA